MRWMTCGSRTASCATTSRRSPSLREPYTPGDTARQVHDRQHYELVSWRRADDELNYRRFFGVNTLAGVRVEIPWVFDETHAEIGRWFREGLVDGLRIDHPDGLADPAGYLEQLSELTGGAYVLVEKILEPGEKLPEQLARSRDHRLRRARRGGPPVRGSAGRGTAHGCVRRRALPAHDP